ncbi:MAG: winged helix-turn-helix domain-containing protein [Tepidamorphaceae bacterium]
MLKFGEFEIDDAGFELRCNGKAQHVEPKVFDMLVFLCSNAGRIITKEEIVSAVWDGRFVSDATVSGCVKAARKALGDSGAEPVYIHTVRGRGFRFCADVEKIKDDAAVSGMPTSVSGKFQPVLGIRLFEAGKGSDKEIATARSLNTSLGMVLSRVPLLEVAADADNPSVTYLLDGNIQETGDVLKVSVQLSETANGFRLWAHQFELPEGQSINERLVYDIVSRLEPQLVRAIFKDSSRPDGELGSRQLLLQAMGLIVLKGWHKTVFMQAAELLRKSISLEPDLALSRAHLSLLLALGHRVGLLRDSDEVVVEAIAQAESALDLDNMDSIVLGLTGCAFSDIGQAERGIPLLQNAIKINPCNGQAWSALGAAYLTRKRTEEAVQNLSHGISISPADSRLSAWGAILSVAYLHNSQSAEAAAAAHEACLADDKTYLPRVAGVAAHLALMEREQAKAYLREALRIKPDLNENEVCCLVGHKPGALVCEMMKAGEA